MLEKLNTNVGMEVRVFHGRPKLYDATLYGEFDDTIILHCGENSQAIPHSNIAYVEMRPNEARNSEWLKIQLKDSPDNKKRLPSPRSTQPTGFTAFRNSRYEQIVSLLAKNYLPYGKLSCERDVAGAVSLLNKQVRELLGACTPGHAMAGELRNVMKSDIVPGIQAVIDLIAEKRVGVTLDEIKEGLGR